MPVKLVFDEKSGLWKIMVDVDGLGLISLSISPLVINNDVSFEWDLKTLLSRSKSLHEEKNASKIDLAVRCFHFLIQ